MQRMQLLVVILRSVFRSFRYFERTFALCKELVVQQHAMQVIVVFAAHCVGNPVVGFWICAVVTDSILHTKSLDPAVVWERALMECDRLWMHPRSFAQFNADAVGKCSSCAELCVGSASIRSHVLWLPLVA